MHARAEAGCAARARATLPRLLAPYRAHACRYAEAVQLALDPSVPLEALLAAFWAAHDPTHDSTHDPTHADALGAARSGASEASTIFYHSAAQRDAALAARVRLQQATLQRLETRIRPATAFWEAAPDAEPEPGG